MLCDRVAKVLDYFMLPKSRAAREFGVTHKTFASWLTPEGEKHLWQYLPTFLDWYPRLSRQWLYFGEGPMIMGHGVPIDEPLPLRALVGVAEEIARDAGSDDYRAMLEYMLGVPRTDADDSAEPQKTPPPQANHAVPLLGFGACSTAGWCGVMTIPVPVEPPVWHDKMMAVMASGESMLPAGIGHGHVCYCDPTKEPVLGEAVFVTQQDGAGTIKLFCGRTVRGGSDYVKLQGWLDKKEADGPQKPFSLEVLASDVNTIAPIVYVRRRL